MRYKLEISREYDKEVDIIYVDTTTPGMLMPPFIQEYIDKNKIENAGMTEFTLRINPIWKSYKNDD
jgi:hypothetical protein